MQAMKLHAYFYWCTVGENWKFKQHYWELLEHCLANTNVWNFQDAFTQFNGGVGSGYNSDAVDDMLAHGERFQIFYSYSQAAKYAKGIAQNIYAYSVWPQAGEEGKAVEHLAQCLERVEEMEDSEQREVHDNLVNAFYRVFKTCADRWEKKDAIEYAK